MAKKKNTGILMTELEQFYENQEPELREVYLALRQIILNQDENITAEWKFQLPFFYYKRKMLCYLWYHKKLKLPYISFMDANLLNDKRLLMENRKRAGILLINPQKDLPVKLVKEILTLLLQLPKNRNLKNNLK